MGFRDNEVKKGTENTRIGLKNGETPATLPKHTLMVNGYAAIGVVGVALVTAFWISPAVNILIVAGLLAALTSARSLWAVMSEQTVAVEYIDDGSEALRDEAESIIQQIEQSTSVFLASHIPTLRQLVGLRSQLAEHLKKLRSVPSGQDPKADLERINQQISNLSGKDASVVRDSLHQQQKLAQRRVDMHERRIERIARIEAEIRRIDMQVSVLKDEVMLHGNDEEAMLAALGELTKVTTETSTWIEENADLDRSTRVPNITRSKAEALT